MRRFRPFFLRLASTARPEGVSMRLRKPCLFLRFRLLGLYVCFTFSPLAFRSDKALKYGALKTEMQYIFYDTRAIFGSEIKKNLSAWG